jgi:hypothetical protein
VKQFEKMTLTDVDLDTLGSDVNATEERHKHRSGRVWSLSREFL